MSTSAPSADFLKFIGFVLDHEGRYFENDPNDTGDKGDGKTPGNYGTHFGVDAASHPGIDILHLTEQQAIAIYWQEWLDEKVDAIPMPARFVYYDDCVNAGRPDATRILQEALVQGGAVLTVDAVLGPVTLVAVAKARADELALRMLELRDKHYELIAERNPSDARYLTGWLNRVGDLRRSISGFAIV
jgi:type VI secretion system secreted protein VgrG